MRLVRDIGPKMFSYSWFQNSNDKVRLVYGDKQNDKIEGFTHFNINDALSPFRNERFMFKQAWKVSNEYMKVKLYYDV
jgi:hypothetical protein